MSQKKITMKRGWKHRFFVEMLLSDAELELLAGRLFSPGVDFKEEWLAQRGKICMSGRDDSQGLGAEVNDIFALGLAVLAFQENKQLKPEESYWHLESLGIPKIEKLEIDYVSCEWEGQDLDEWMDVDEFPATEEDDRC